MRCPRCEKELAGGTIGRLCPICLIDAALPEDETASESAFRYDLIEEIARGGMGVVYRAVQHGSQRQVAVKMISGDHAAMPGALERFRAEAEAIGSLDHPNILPIYEAGEFEGAPFYSMKLADGGTLRERVPHYRRRFRETAKLIATIARAVHHAHQRGILHRDLKPGNILLDGEAQTPFVSDFGLAKWIARDDRLTVATSALGTPHYIAPEQARGASADLTTAADAYSLGAILYELLTGRPPFEGATPLDTLRLVTDAQPVSPREVEATIPRDLEIICLKCLSKEPGDRYSSAERLADDLERWLDDRSILARPAATPERLWRWAKRSPALATLSVATILLLVSLAIGSTVAAARIAKARDRSVAAEKEATEKLWNSYLAQARASRLTGRPGQRADALAAISKAARIHPGPELRNEAIAALALFDIRMERTWPILPSRDQSVSFDEKLEVYASEEADGKIVVKRVSDQKEIARLSGPGARAEFIYPLSPQADYVTAKFGNGQTCLWHLPNPTPLLTLQGSMRGGLGDCAFSPQTNLYAFTLPEGGVDIYRLDELIDSSAPGSVQPWRHWPMPDQRVQGIEFDPSGTKLAIADVADGDITPEKRRRTGGVQLRQIETGETLWNFPNAEGIGSAFWSADGTQLAASSWDKNVHIIDATNGAELRLLRGHKDAATRAKFNHRGSRLVSAGLDGSMIFWDLMSGENLLRVTMEGPPFIAPDDQRIGLMVNDASAGLLAIEETRVFQAWRPPGNPGRPLSFAVSADGNYLASTGFTGVYLWDAAHTRFALSIPTDEVRVSAVAFLDHGESSSILIGDEGQGYAEHNLGLDPSSVPDQPRVRLGPPLPWLHDQGWRLETVSPDGKLAALSARDRKRPSIVVALDDPSRPFELLGQEQTHGIVFSRDSSLVAGGSWSNDGVAIWSASSGALLGKLEENSEATAVFDPSGRWLITGTPSGYHFWSLGDWQPGPRLELSELTSWKAAFSSDGRYLAVLSSAGRVGLYDAATVEHLAELEAPISIAPRFLNFSGAGRWLNLLGTDQTIQRWDLVALREELTTLGLSW